MAAVSEKYQHQAPLPFSPTELGDFHRFHAHPWDTDDQFQAGLRTITQTQAMDPSFSELLKMKQYYFSTRMSVQINLDNYLSWRKHPEQPSDDPNVPIFKRFDEYNFDTDRKFQQGLPSIIGQLIKDGKSTLDKAALQKEMTKAKAFYYARFIELFDFPAYLGWKEMEKSQAGPACPYAHLWQNKGKGSGNELEEDAQKFLTTTQPLSTGALQVHIHSPATKNSFTGVRLAKMSQAFAEAKTEESITSVYWTVNSGKSTHNERDPESEIVTKDEKWFSGGVTVGAPSENAESKQDSAQVKERLRQYYSLVDEINAITNEHGKPVVRIVDGIVSLSAAYLAFGAAGQRVITENATLSFTPSTTEAINSVNNPFAGLYLLAQIQANSKNDTSARPLPKGVAHYLAFCPDYILRGPDLRKLGLADFFISSSKKKDIDEAIVSVAGCPPPHTTQAIRMALNAEVVYPGPAKIDVWRSEIEECFGDAVSLKDIVSNLEKYSNNWSKSIRAYIASLEPVCAELLFKAIEKTAELTSFKEIAQLEYRLTQRYSEFEASTEEEKTTKALADLGDFFVPLEAEEAELFNFDFATYLKEHQEDKELANSVSTSTSIGENGADATQACPYLIGKVTANGESVVPSDHPQIPGVDFSDPEAAKACPYLASKEDGTQEKTEVAAPPPADHPSIPGVDFSDPEAIKACPFLSAKNKREEATVMAAKEKEASSAMPSDHPVIPGVDFSNPDAIKACPFLSSQQQQLA
ncbi:hypothetical protein EC957_001750 [Mortierella hygrophila]|uniref:3-hydroxyisobutyryl-CoA hydrolase n=1 Tax=Mortierella hygrophila TaxID=979708 RepID=A0A9P6K1P8_9FUNG|nr:hypothetical protein EC957_001750 [Mortierella hygrophila]